MALGFSSRFLKFLFSQLEKKREQIEQKERKRALKALDGPGSQFASAASLERIESEFINDTVGLVAKEDYAAKRAKAELKKEEMEAIERAKLPLTESEIRAKVKQGVEGHYSCTLQMRIDAAF
jgi:hypothetical protein